MSTSPDVTISTAVARGNIARENFGAALLLSADAPDLHASYGALDEVAAVFAVDSPEYRAASAYFAQPEHPTLLHVGKWATAETRVLTVGILTVQNSADYVLQVCTPDGDFEVSVTSDASATNDEIVALLVTDLNAIAGNNYTAAATGTSGSQIVTITADAAGDWFEIGASAAGVPDTRIQILQTNVDPGASATLNAIANVSDDWFCVLPLSGSDAVIKAVAGWAESNKKICVARTWDVASLTSAGASDTLEDLQTLERQNTVGIYHATAGEFCDAAFCAAFLVTDPGTRSAKFLTLGQTANRLTTNQRANLEARNANTYLWHSVGFPMFTSGTTASGEWIDLVRLTYAIESYVSYDALNFLRRSVGYTRKGIKAIANRVRATLQEFVNTGAIVDGSVSVTTPDIAAITAETKRTRVLSGVKYSAEAAGAVHKLELKGEVTP